MNDIINKSYEDRIKDIKDNLYAGGGAIQAEVILNVMLSAFSQKEFTGNSDISIDSVLGIISQEIKNLKRVIRDGGIVTLKTFETTLKNINIPHMAYACLDKDLKFCVKHFGEEDWKDILYVFPYMNCKTAYDVSFKYDI